MPANSKIVTKDLIIVFMIFILSFFSLLVGCTKKLLFSSFSSFNGLNYFFIIFFSQLSLPTNFASLNKTTEEPAHEMHKTRSLADGFRDTTELVERSTWSARVLVSGNRLSWRASHNCELFSLELSVRLQTCYKESWELNSAAIAVSHRKKTSISTRVSCASYKWVCWLR